MNKYFAYSFIISAFLFATRLPAQPAIQWQKCLGGYNRDAGGPCRQTLDGGYVLTGETKSNDGDVSGNHGVNDIWVAKLDATGNLQWQKCLGGSHEDFGRDIQETPDGGYIVLGTVKSFDGDITGRYDTIINYTDCWLAKLDNVGNLQWQKCLGGSNVDEGISILVTADNGFIIQAQTGSNDYDVSGNHGPKDIWLVKTDSVGTIQWQQCYGGTNSERDGQVITTLDGGYAFSCFTASNNGDVTGNHGGYDMWVVKTDAAGNMQWQKCYGGTINDVNNHILQNADSSYVVSGSSSSNNGDVSGNHGLNDGWVIKIDAAGNLLWQKCIGGIDSDGIIATISANGQYVSGAYTESNDGDVSGNHSPGFTDFWVIKINASGTLVWQKCYGGNGTDQISAIIPTIDGGYLMTGSANSLNGDVIGLHDTTGTGDVWVVKLAPDTGTAVQEVISENGMIHVWPNPANDVFIVKSGNTNDKATITIYDQTGKAVYIKENTLLNTRCTLAHLAKGVYYLKVSNSYLQQTVKVVKM